MSDTVYNVHAYYPSNGDGMVELFGLLIIHFWHLRRPAYNYKEREREAAIVFDHGIVLTGTRPGATYSPSTIQYQKTERNNEI